MRLKSILTILSMVSFINIYATDYHEDTEKAPVKHSPNAHPQTASSNNLGIYGKYLYWQIGSYNTFYQTTCEQASDAINPQNLYPMGGTKFVRTDAKTTSGFAVGVEYLIPEVDKWIFGVQYQWIQHNITTVNNCCNPCNPCKGCDDAGWAWWGACCWLGQAQFGLTNSASADNPEDEIFWNKSYSIDEIQFAKNSTLWQSIDFSLSKAMYVDNSKHISFEPKMGIECNWFTIESYFNGKFLERNYYIEQNGGNLNADAENDYFQWCLKDTPWAIGPFAGANLALRFSKQPSSASLFGDFKVAELYTHHNYNQVYTEENQDAADEECNTTCDKTCCDNPCCGPTDRFDTTMLHTNVTLGIGYVHIPEECDIGYDFSVAWELNSFVNFFDSIHAWMWHGDLTYQGLTVTLGIYF